MHEDRANIWIAQREGRAKDGNDKTNPAIISMLALHKDKQQEFSDYIANTHIVPVSISYEYDPCDTSKARELTLKAEEGQYLKGEQEDVQSIARGITGYKGAVHLAFGAPLGLGLESVEQVTERLDDAIIANYVLHPPIASPTSSLPAKRLSCRWAQINGHLPLAILYRSGRFR